MSTIVTRSGKGSALTNAEVDANFTNLNTDKVEVVGAPTDGQAVIWDADNSQWVPGAVDALPTQTGNEGKYLQTNGTTASWADVSSIVASDTAPTSPVAGMVWVNTLTGVEYTYIVDVDSSQWVELGPTPTLVAAGDIDADGGSAVSTYLAAQKINGGTA